MKSQNYLLKSLLITLIGLSFVACSQHSSSSGGSSGYFILSSEDQATLADGVLKVADVASASQSTLSGSQLIAATATPTAKMTAQQAFDFKAAVAANCTKTMTPEQITSYPVHVVGSLSGANCPILMNFKVDVEASAGIFMKVKGSYELKIVAEPWASSSEVSRIMGNLSQSYQFVANGVVANIDSTFNYELKDGSVLSLHFYGTSLQPDKNVSGNYTITRFYDFSFKGIKSSLKMVHVGEVGKARTEQIFLNGEEITDANRDKFAALFDAICKFIYG